MDAEKIARGLTDKDAALLLAVGPNYGYLPASTTWTDVSDLRRWGLVQAYRGHRGHKARLTAEGSYVQFALRGGSE